MESTTAYSLLVEVDDGSGPSMLKVPVPSIADISASIREAQLQVELRLKGQASKV